MTRRSKQEYTEAVHRRYTWATRQEKTLILDEYCATCGCHRKHAIRVLRNFKRFTKPRHGKRGRPSRYNNEDSIGPLKKIRLAANLPCSKRLKVLLPLWLPGYEQTFGPLSGDVRHGLNDMSPSTFNYSGKVSDILALDMTTNARRAILVSSVNAIMAYHGSSGVDGPKGALVRGLRRISIIS